ncbi:ferric reductase-like transmembrane domain-containing protein [bacterium]|nr:MAG: ferric reductase-like transmembrane domain-containing protein [bacterium]
MKRLAIYSFFLTNFAITLGFWWYFNGESFVAGGIPVKLLMIGKLSGLIATIFALNQLLLIGRIKWIESVFGLDKLSRVHKWTGYITLLLIVSHVSLVTRAYSLINDIGYFSQYFSFLTEYDDVIYAFIALVILFTTVGLSITIIRRNLKYEWWYYVHIFNYAAFFLFALHQFEYGLASSSEWFRAYWLALYSFVALHILYFRFFKPLYNFQRFGFTIDKVESENGVATSVYITGNNIEKFTRRSGQFMIFRFLQKGFYWQKHPFSLSWGAHNKEIRLTAKKLGDFTELMPNLKPGTKVLVDGPHGVFTSDKIRQNKVLLIAGGIGITPLRSLSEELAGNIDLTLIYSAKTRNEAVLLEELKNIQNFSSSQHPFKLIEIYSDEKVTGAEHGMLNKGKLVQLVPDLTERDVFLCGPPAMMKALKSAMAELGLPKKQLHWERFAL